MNEEEQKMEKAVATLWDTFSSSPLALPQKLAKVGLESYSGSSYFYGWDGTVIFMVIRSSACCEKMVQDFFGLSVFSLNRAKLRGKGGSRAVLTPMRLLG